MKENYFFFNWIQSSVRTLWNEMAREKCRCLIQIDGDILLYTSASIKMQSVLWSITLNC